MDPTSLQNTNNAGFIAAKAAFVNGQLEGGVEIDNHVVNQNSTIDRASPPAQAFQIENGADFETASREGYCMNEEDKDHMSASSFGLSMEDGIIDARCGKKSDNGSYDVGGSEGDDSKGDEGGSDEDDSREETPYEVESDEGTSNEEDEEDEQSDSGVSEVSDDDYKDEEDNIELKSKRETKKKRTRQKKISTVDEPTNGEITEMEQEGVLAGEVIKPFSGFRLTPKVHVTEMDDGRMVDISHLLTNYNNDDKNPTEGEAAEPGHKKRKLKRVYAAVGLNDKMSRDVTSLVGLTAKSPLVRQYLVQEMGADWVPSTPFQVRITVGSVEPPFTWLIDVVPTVCTSSIEL